MELDLKELLTAPLRYLVETGAKDKITVEEHLGHPFAIGGGKAYRLHWPEPEPIYAPDVLYAMTLSGLVEVLLANVDGWNLDKFLVNVVAANRVILVGPLEGKQRDRCNFAEALCHTGNVPSRPEPLQSFRQSVFATFVDNEDRKRLLEETAGFAFESAIIQEEGADGAGYSTMDKREAVARSKVKITNPVYHLRPWWSFPEAGEQPLVPFLLQISGGEGEPTRAFLLDVSGSSWVPAAIEQVANHLKKLVVEADVSVAVIS